MRPLSFWLTALFTLGLIGALPASVSATAEPQVASATFVTGRLIGVTYVEAAEAGEASDDIDDVRGLVQVQRASPTQPRGCLTGAYWSWEELRLHCAVPQLRSGTLRPKSSRMRDHSTALARSTLPRCYRMAASSWSAAAVAPLHRPRCGTPRKRRWLRGHGDVPRPTAQKHAEAAHRPEAVTVGVSV